MPIPTLTAQHLDRLLQETEDFESRGLFEPGSADQVRKNLRAARQRGQAVAEADLIEEAVLERPEVKKAVLRTYRGGGPPRRSDRQQYVDLADW